MGEEGEGGKADQNSEPFTTSVCIIGPNGSGKSIFALHMASAYLADCIQETSMTKRAPFRLPIILYISTDFTFTMANGAWSKFALNQPFLRKDPFFSNDPMRKISKPVRIPLKPCKPTDMAEMLNQFEREDYERNRVVFVDIASYTAGDDWGFLHRLLSLLPEPERSEDPRHLVVIDAIEGFEAFAGEVNAFGEKSTRRSP